jgi:hypothetical protein
MRFNYQLGNDVTMHERNASAIYSIGEVTVSPVGVITMCPVCASVEIEVKRLTFWGRIILWLKSLLEKLR